MTIEYRDTKIFEPEQLQELFASVRWSSAKHPGRLKEAIAGSATIFSAWDRDNLVGLINAMTDDAMTVYCHYLLVRPQYQGKGVGQHLVKMLKDEYVDFLKIVLICNEPEVKFYEKCGFSEPKDLRVMYLTDMKD